MAHSRHTKIQDHIIAAYKTKALLMDSSRDLDDGTMINAGINRDAKGKIEKRRAKLVQKRRAII